MTRNDSEYTPYFIPTPQRTESNWGDSAYHQTNNNGKEAQLQDAIQNVRAPDNSIRADLKNAAVAHTISKLKSQIRGDGGDLNIKIEN